MRRRGRRWRVDCASRAAKSAGSITRIVLPIHTDFRTVSTAHRRTGDRQTLEAATDGLVTQLSVAAAFGEGLRREGRSSKLRLALSEGGLDLLDHHRKFAG